MNHCLSLPSAKKQALGPHQTSFTYVKRYLSLKVGMDTTFFTFYWKLKTLKSNMIKSYKLVSH